MNINEIVQALQACRKTGQNSYQAKCPAHDDQKASLTVTDAGDKILMYCHAGCTTKAILEKLGLTEKDLFKSTNNQVNSKIVAEYFYTDEKGIPLYKAVRLEPKSFFQMRYYNGNWIQKMNGARYVLYNLPNVIASNEIYFVEGEKDADNLNKIGLVATTTVGGASGFNKHKDEYANPLKNKTVYIIPDNDKSGRKYADNIKTALNGIALEVKILKLSNVIGNLKEKADISDVLQQYGKEKTLEILNSLIEHSSEEEDTIYGNDTKLTLELFKKVLEDFKIEIKYDEFKGEVVIRNHPKELSKNNILNTFPIYITDYMNNNGIKCTVQKVCDFINVIADINTYNPVNEILNQVTWDKRDRLNELYSIMGITNEAYKIYIRKWLLQSITLLNNNLENRYSADGVLVLQGRQGIGKTSIFRKLSIKEEFFTEGVSFNAENKDDLINCTSTWICELGELDHTLKKDQSILKGILTRSEDKIRYPFAKNFTIKPRKTSFCGTVNEENFIKDTTGSRRFWIVKLDENYNNEKIQNLTKEWIIQLWKQVEEIWKSSDKHRCYRLTQEEIKLLEKNNKQYNLLLVGEQEIEDSLDFSIPKEKYCHMTVTEIKEHLGLKNIDSGKLGKALKSLSEKYPDYIIPARKGNYKIYHIPLRTLCNDTNNK